MKKINVYLIVLIALVAFSLLIQGCTSDASNDSSNGANAISDSQDVADQDNGMADQDDNIPVPPSLPDE